jgi:hypothetical protein
MATTPNDIQQEPTMRAKVIEKISAPVADYTSRQRLAFIAAAAAATQAQQPFAAILVAILVGLAYDRKR